MGGYIRMDKDLDDEPRIPCARELGPSADPAAGLRCPACVEWQRLAEAQQLYARAVRGSGRGLGR